MKRIRYMICMICAICIMMLTGCVSTEYNNALTLMENGDYTGAKAILDTIPDYGDAAELLALCKKELDYAGAERYMREEKFEEALAIFNELGSFKASKDYAVICSNFITYFEAVALYEDGQWLQAFDAFESLGAYRDAEARARRCKSEAILAEAEELLQMADRERDSEAASLIYAQVAGLLSGVSDTAATRERHNTMSSKCIYEQTLIGLRKRAAKTGNNSDFYEYAEQLRSCGRYSNASQLAAVVGALGERNIDVFSKTMLEYENEISSSVDLRELLDRFLEWHLPLDDSLALLPLFCAIDETASKDAPFAEIEPEYRWSIEVSDADEEIFARCGVDSGAAQAGDIPQDGEPLEDEPASPDKLLILVRMNKPDGELYTVPLSVMSALPDEALPLSLDEVGYILYIDCDYVDDGLYDIGTRGIREKATITLFSAPGKKSVKSWQNIFGDYSPATFSFDGEPPLYKSGGPPDPEKILESCSEALDILLALLPGDD